MSQAITQQAAAPAKSKPSVALRDSSKLQLIHRTNSQASCLSAVSNSERSSANPSLPLSHRAGPT